MPNPSAQLFCHLWPLWLYDIFPQYLPNGVIFGGGMMGEDVITEYYTYVLIFSTPLCLKHFLF